MKSFPRSRLLQYTGRTNYSEAEEKLLFYCGRDGYRGHAGMYVGNMPYVSRSTPISLNTVIKVTGSKETGLDVVVGGMKVVYLPLTPRDLFPVDYINRLDTMHGETATNQLLSALQFESIYDRTRAIFGLKPKGNNREEWVEDFLEMVYPLYNRQKISPPPILEKMYSHVGTIGHLDHSVSVLGRAIQGERSPDWIRKLWEEYVTEAAGIGETLEDPIYSPEYVKAYKEVEEIMRSGLRQDVIPVRLPGETTPVPVFDELGKPILCVIDSISQPSRSESIKDAVDRMGKEITDNMPGIPWDKDSGPKEQ